jgi:four helix bundle protein
MSAGSVNELEYHTILAQDLGFTAPDQATLLYERCEEVRRMLIRFVEKLAAGGR